MITNLCGPGFNRMALQLVVESIQLKLTYKNQNLKNHQAEISQLILSKTVFIKGIKPTTN